ncbi:MAG: DUF63 family protein [Candidatus Nanoarchaeia archaeon]|jgi:uncharacterized membrane protein
MTTTINESNNIPSFFEEFFIRPVIERSGYNIVNTIVYGALLVFGAYALFKLLKKLGYKIDLNFFKATVPFILLVAVWHSLTDAGIYQYGFWTTTPGLYLPVLLLFLPLIILSKKLEQTRGWRYEYLYSGVSIVLLLSQLIIFSIIAPSMISVEALMMVIFYTILSCAPIIILSNYWKPLKNKLNLIMILSHFFDASVTHVSLAYYNYFEQHVIPNFIFNLFNSSLSFYPWKLIVLGAVIYVLDKDKSNKELTDFVKMIFITYGLATGVRGMLRLIMGV